MKSPNQMRLNAAALVLLACGLAPASLSTQSTDVAPPRYGTTYGNNRSASAVENLIEIKLCVETYGILAERLRRSIGISVPRILS